MKLFDIGGATRRENVTLLGSAPGGRPDSKHLEQHAQARRWRTLFNTTAVFAHEVANPLHGLLTCLQLVDRTLEIKQVKDPILTTTIHDMKRELDRLGLLLNEFRSVSVPQRLDLKKRDLRRIVEEVLAVQIDAYRTAGVNVKFEFEATCPAVNVDEAKIKQVILNLCKNAVEAMPQGGCLTVKSHCSGDMVVLEISDNGVGIPVGVDVFALFKTTKVGGSGLGLHVVEQIVLAHSGTIDYTSEPDSGTTFQIVLPIDGASDV
jgi:two-component system sporulation sensor kinase A